MNGAESLQRTLLNCGVDTCFMNPGTSEMHFVAALDNVPGMRPVLTLFEGVATGAADGYGRMAQKPAATLLHLGPGLANGMANLHNARRAASPVVNIVGDHATYHRDYDAPLTSDAEGMAATVSKWVKASQSADEVGPDAAEAVARSLEHQRGVCTLVLPADTAWNEANGPAEPLTFGGSAPVDDDVIRSAAEELGAAGRKVLLIGGVALLSRGLQAAARIAAKTGAEVFCDTITARIERGSGQVKIRRLPYFPEAIEQTLAGTTSLVIAGTRSPVAFFAYPDKPSDLTPEGVTPIQIASPADDPIAALEALADEVNAPPFADIADQACAQQALPEMPSGELSVDNVGKTIAVLLPEGAVICDDAATSGVQPYLHTAGSPPHDWLSVTGGAIGQGMPVGIGAAVARPQSKVICLEGDGSAMYTIQSLWTQARENLDVTNIVFSNRSYAILAIEYKRLRDHLPGPRAHDMLDLTRPDLNFAKMAEGMGVEAFRCETIDDFNSRFRYCMQESGPRLIEVVLPPRK